MLGIRTFGEIADSHIQAMVEKHAMLKEKNPPRIGVSTVTLVPYSLGVWGPWNSLRIAKKAGLDGLQIMPLRGWYEWNTQNMPEYRVLSYEGPWHTVNKLDLSYALFGDAKKAQRRASHFGFLFPEARAIDMPRGGAVEVSPVHYTKVEEYLTLPEVVFDTYHAFGGTNKYGVPIQYTSHVKDPLDLVAKLIERRNLKMVHLQPVRGKKGIIEICDFLGGCGRLWELMEVIVPSRVPIIIEYHPRQAQGQLVKLLSETREKIWEMC